VRSFRFAEHGSAAFGAALLVVTTCIPACSFDRGERWFRETADESTALCNPEGRSCGAEGLVECNANGTTWDLVEDCQAENLVCSTKLGACATCNPGDLRCDGADVQVCADDGSRFESRETCDTERGSACRNGGCTNLCALAAEHRSNVGCEYWAVDLDNANIDESLNAAAQQFAVVISNPQPDVPATVTIEQDDTVPGAAGAPITTARATVLPLSLRVFRLGPREVDGSPPGEFDTGTHSALTRSAYRITTSVPVVAYQFNPLENVNVFSNDASLLKPAEALALAPGTLVPSYVVLGWPQTIASTDDPDTNFDPGNPLNLRAFMTVVGTRPGTHVRVTPRARILGGAGIPAAAAGDTIDLLIDAFDVANLESDDFNADFTGSLIEADQPIAVFSGSEASDAPFFRTLGERRCCADHLEEQLDPLRTAGKTFVAAVSPNRSRAITAAGGDVGDVEAPEYFRIIAATDAGAIVTTSLSGGDAQIELSTRGDFAQIESTTDFMVRSDQPIMLASISASQDAAGVPTGFPGGDPSFLLIPPVEQFRPDYVFLTPDRYSFDFIRLLVPEVTAVFFDGQPLSELACETMPLPSLTDADVPFTVFRCQLSFPVLDTSVDATEPLRPGRQNDGVHQITANRNIGVLVDGFDRNVSYAYAAGTQLEQLVLR
jgi:hypothetical protein